MQFFVKLLLIHVFLFVNTCINASVYTKHRIFTDTHDLDLFNLQIEPNALTCKLPLDPGSIINFQHVNSLLGLEKVKDEIISNGFVVLKGGGNNFSKEYECMAAQGIPLFITSDTFVYLYNILYQRLLADLNVNTFYPVLRDLTAALLQDSLNTLKLVQSDQILYQAAIRNVRYLSVAQKLINPRAPVAKQCAEYVQKEVARIQIPLYLPSDEGIGESSDVIVTTAGTRDSEGRMFSLIRYFKTVKWYQSIFCFVQDNKYSEDEVRILTLQAALLVESLGRIKVGQCLAIDALDRIQGIRSFFIGGSDVFSAKDFQRVLFGVLGEDFTCTDLNSKKCYSSIYAELKRINNKATLSKYSKCLNLTIKAAKGMCLLGDNRAMDSEIFKRLSFPYVSKYTGSSAKKPFCLEHGYRVSRGLDVMAVLGSVLARGILNNQGDIDFKGYEDQLNTLSYDISKLSHAYWQQNIDRSWLYACKSLLTELPAGYPEFMRTAAWQRKQLHSALCSWAALQHKTILYAKQLLWYKDRILCHNKKDSSAGYIEPVEQYYLSLLSLTKMTLAGLKEFKIKSETKQLIAFEKLLKRTISISRKELINQKLSAADDNFIRTFYKSLNKITAEINSVDLETPIISDVFRARTDNAISVSEAVGELDTIVAACSRGPGKIYLMAGPVLSYYEFKHPLDDFYTDAGWRKYLSVKSSKNTKEISRPKWYEIYKTNSKASDSCFIIRTQ